MCSTRAEEITALAVIISSGYKWNNASLPNFNQLFCTIWQSHQSLFSRHPTFLAGIVFQTTGLGEIDNSVIMKWSGLK